MFENTRSKPWNPYVAGALAGLLLVLSVWVAGKYFGASTTFVRAAGMVEQTVAAERVAAMPYFMKEMPKVDWQMMFVVGIMVGSCAAALASGTFRLQAVPDRFAARFGPGLGKRFGLAFVGGMVAMFGARLADGCPSGHGLSGTLQLAASGYVALICFFVGGAIVARLLYGNTADKTGGR
ncbi:MAG: YeeE/YedE thiosulfate transporter family protein [Humidesulfovibrio sp.]|nr:YeeE/YedE thiosulfate transporter family protein [Humidesulfovibrio sp.]